MQSGTSRFSADFGQSLGQCISKSDWEGRIMPPMTRNLTCLTLAAFMVVAPLAPAPLLAKPATSTSPKAPVDSTGWMRADPKMDRFVADLMAKMTLDEKVGQLTLLTSNWESTGPTMRDSYKEDVRAGRVGAIFNAYTAKYTRELQALAVEGTRLKIPLIFGYDVIHGHRTIFPISLGEAASWDMQAIEKSARVSAIEASAEGIHWTFSPMVDIARDARWGRVSEGAGEDVYLGSLIAKARVRGYQGDDLSRPDTILATAKHFAAYGAAQAGRDYHTVDISERTLRDVYLPPFKAALDALFDAINDEILKDWAGTDKDVVAKHLRSLLDALEA